MAVFWVVAPFSLMAVRRRLRGAFASIAVIMEAASTSETSVNFHQTVWHNNPEDSHLRIRRSEDLKSRVHLVTHLLIFIFLIILTREYVKLLFNTDNLAQLITHAFSFVIILKNMLCSRYTHPIYKQ
jgi:hypothetical protein